MTARTALTPTVLVRDSDVADPAGTSIAGLVAGGAYVADFPGPNHVIIRVDNTDSSAHNFTVRAGGNGNTAAGGTNPGVPFEAATVGDLVVSVGATSTAWFGPFTTDRFTQSDGSLSVDFASGFTGTISVFQMPYSGIEP
jgi:hypothetical protein